MHFSTLPTPLNCGRTYSRMRLSSALRPRTIRPCTAHDTQYCCLMYSLGRVYSTSQPRIAKRTLVNGSVADISLGRRVHDVSHLETLHGLILRAHAHFPSLYLADATTAVGAADGVHVTSSLLGTTMVSSNALIPMLNRAHTTPSPMHRTDTYLRLKGMLADYG